MTTTILDRALNGPDRHKVERIIDPPIMAAIRRATPTARRFVFSTKASRLIGRFAFECPDLIIDNWQFAQPPYQNMYFEYDAQAFMEASPQGADPTGDQRVGYLISGVNVFVLVRAGRDHVANGITAVMDGICPIWWKVAGPGQAVSSNVFTVGKIVNLDELAGRVRGKHPSFPETSRRSSFEWLSIASALGSALDGLDYVDEASLDAMFQAVKPQVGLTQKAWTLFGTPGEADPDGNGQLRLFNAQMGDIRTLWAFLLWLNQPKHTRLVDMPAGHRIVSGKRIAYAKHHVVEIDLSDRVRTMRRHFELLGPRASPRRHEVRGFYRHWGGDEGHGHVWPLFPDVDGHWQCTGCGRKRTWVTDHVRGDAEKGFVTKEYAVEVGPDDGPGLL